MKIVEKNLDRNDFEVLISTHISHNALRESSQVTLFRISRMRHSFICNVLPRDTAEWHPKIKQFLVNIDCSSCLVEIHDVALQTWDRLEASSINDNCVSLK